MARPIRDFTTETARSGDATRAFTRFSDGSDWLQTGIGALERAAGDITRVIAERVEQANRLEDATARSEAIQKTRLRMDERLRSLDARSPDYPSEVERITSETIQAVASETNWRASITRDQYLVDATQLRTQALLHAADRREAAVVNAAKEQVETALARSVAAIAQAPGSRDIQLLNLENEIGPILQNVRPEVRDALIKSVREATAEEAALGFVISRNFGAAEQALKTYGGQGLLSPQVVRRIRANLEAEKRQASAERAARINPVFEGIRGLFLENQVAEGAQALEAALASGSIRRGSDEHTRLESLRRQAEARARDRGTEQLNAAVDALRSGGGTAAHENQVAVAIAREVFADARDYLASLGPEAMSSPDVATRVLADAERTARERTILTLIDLRPDRTPTRLRDAVKMAAQEPARRPELGEFLGRLYTRNPGTVEAVLREDPILGVAMDDLRNNNSPITAVTLQARLTHMPREPRAAQEWTRETSGSQPSLKPDEVLAKAAERLMPTREVRQATTPAQQSQLHEDFKRAWLAGFTPEQAADFATRRLLGETHLSLAGTKPVRLNRENAPATYFPSSLLDLYDRDFIERQIVAQVLTEYAKSVGTSVAKLREEYDFFVSAMPVLVNGQERAAFVAFRQSTTPGAPLVQVTTAPGQPWQFIVPTGDPAQVRQAFEQAFGLLEERNRLLRDRGRSAEAVEQSEAAAEAQDAGLSRLRGQAERAQRAREGRDNRPIGERLNEAIESLPPGPPSEGPPRALTNKPVGQNLRAPSPRRVIDTILGRTTPND